MTSHPKYSKKELARRAERLRERLAWASNPPPGVMPVAEIRYWLTALVERHGWAVNSLARTLGMRQLGQLKHKASGESWIYRTEQLRFSRVLKRIISGELICRRYIRIAGGCQLAERPVPLPQPVRYGFDMKVGKLRRYLPRLEGTSTVPTFQGALKNAGRWRECTFPEEERRERNE